MAVKDRGKYKIPQRYAHLGGDHYFEDSLEVEDEIVVGKNLTNCLYADFFYRVKHRRSTIFLVHELEQALSAAEQGNNEALDNFGRRYAYRINSYGTAREILQNDLHSKDCKLLILRVLQANLIGTTSGELIVPAEHHGYGWFGAGPGGYDRPYDTISKFESVLEQGGIDDNGLGERYKICDAKLFGGFMSLDPDLRLFRKWMGKLDQEKLEDVCFRLTGCGLWDPVLFDRMATIIDEREKGIFARLKDSNGNGVLWHAMPTFDANESDAVGFYEWVVYETEERRKTQCFAVAETLIKLGCDPLASGKYGLNWNDISSIASFRTSSVIETNRRHRESDKERDLIALVEYYKWRKDRVGKGFAVGNYGKRAKTTVVATGEE